MNDAAPNHTPADLSTASVDALQAAEAPNLRSDITQQQLDAARKVSEAGVLKARAGHTSQLDQ